jgi:hypothetical protein
VPPITTLDGRAIFYPTTFHPSSPSASGASAVTIGSGEEKTGIDIVMRPQPARRVTGRVIADGSPQGSVAIRLVAPDMAASDAGRYPVNNDTPQALTDGNGNFTFIGIAPGLYTARVLMSSATPADPILWAADPVVVGADADVTDLQIRLRSGARISGRVVADPASPPLSAADYRTFGIRAEPLPGTAGSLMGGIDWMTRINENGQLTTGEYVPGSYVIRVLGVPSGWTVQSATIGGRDAIDRPFELPSAGASDLVITVVNRQTQIAGHVRDANGQPAPYTTVAVLPGDRSMWPAGGLTARRMAMIASGRDGKYTLRGLPAGEYVLAAFGSQGLDLWDQRVLTTLAASATRITIADGESRTQDLVVRR